MNFTFTKQESYKGMRFSLSRLAPYIITQIDNPENEKLFQQTLPLLGPHILLTYIASPGALYNFLSTHKNDFIIITDDVFDKRKNYLDVLEGAICSSPDSCALWPVRYLNKPEFEFTGKIILLTKKNKEEIKSNTRFEYFGRDCYFV